MFVLHAAWVRKTQAGANPWLFLWAESRQRYAGLSTDHPRQSLTPSRHPFAASCPELKSLFTGHTGAEELDTLNGSATTFFPTAAALPLPSPSFSASCATTPPQLLIRSENPTAPAIVMQRWQIPGLGFLPTACATALQRLLTFAATPPPEVVCGDDFNYLVGIAGLIDRLLREKRYLPGLECHSHQDNTWYNACWQPCPGDAERLGPHFIRCMPDSFCLTLADHNHYVRPDRQSFFNNLLNVLLDASVRRALSAVPGEEISELITNLPTGIYRTLFRHLTALNSQPLPLSPQQAATHYQSLQQWRLAGAEVTDAQPQYRTCLRLEEPVPAANDPAELAPLTDSDWHLHFLIHPLDDASLLLPAAVVWAAASDSFHYLNRQFPNLQHKLLQDLAAAARIFPPLAPALLIPAPTGIGLSNAEAHSLLAESAGQLQAAGCTVITPNWWRQRRQPIKLLIQEEEDVGPAYLGLSTLATYNLQAMVGDHRLTPNDLENIVACKTPLVHAAGHWREISPTQAAEALQLLRRLTQSQSRLSLIHLLNDYDDDEFECEAAAEPVFSPRITVEAGQHLQTVLARLRGRETLPEVAAPTAFCGVLRPYQLRGVAWLAFLRELELGACLADDMGLGKTIQVIAYLLHTYASGQPATPTLILCPNSVVGNWRRELSNFAPKLRVILHHGPNRLTGAKFQQAVGTTDVVISTYSLVSRDERLLTACAWDTVVLDEAQNIKNAAAIQTTSVLRLPSRHRIALTGTPVENRLSELWSIMHFLNPGYLGTPEEFKQRYALPIERDGDRRQQRTLQRLIQPFLLRRLKTDKALLPDLPAKQETKVYCPLTREQATLYAAVLDVMLQKIAHAHPFTRKALIAATLTKLKQVCNHPVHFLRDGSRLAGRSHKLSRLVEMLDELIGEGRRALIFTQYRQMGNLLQQHLQQEFNLPVYFLHGHTTTKERERLITSFRDDADAPPIFILSLKAGGVGINLTRADTVFHYDRWWNPAVENQATDRAYRIGQTANVQVYKFICPGTLEDHIDVMIENKKQLAANIVDTAEPSLSELSITELRTILDLRTAELEGENADDLIVPSG